MRAQIELAGIKLHSDVHGEYEVSFVKPAAATVKLIASTTPARDVMYLTTRAYKGVYRDDVNITDLTEYPYAKSFEDIKNTKLQTPLEMVHILWLLQDVTRAFTHQLVRYRVGTSFVQESMRFFGMQMRFKILVTGDISKNPKKMEEYARGCAAAVRTYVDLRDKGVADQDARGVLPTNILTNIYFDCSFRTLQGIFPQRLCCQAQPGEWQPILREMRKLIREEMGEELESLLQAPYERGEDCGYKASFDRPCVWSKGNDNVDN